jgi:hypothetical protein
MGPKFHYRVYKSPYPQTGEIYSVNVRFNTIIPSTPRKSRIAQWYSAGLRSGRSEVRVLAVAGNIFLQHRVQAGSVANPASYPMGTRALFLGVKRPGREADHSPPSSAEIKNTWSFTSTPHYAFTTWRSVKAQGQLYIISTPRSSKRSLPLSLPTKILYEFIIFP